MKKITVINSTLGNTWTKTGTDQEITDYVSYMESVNAFGAEGDYVLGEVVDITNQYNSDLVIKKLNVKKAMAMQSIVYINSLVDSWPAADKLTLLARADIQSALTFLNYGSLDQSRDLAASLTIDALFTQSLKDNVLAFIDSKITEFNAMEW